MQNIIQELLTIENTVKKVQASCASEKERLEARLVMSKAQIEKEITELAETESKNIKDAGLSEALSTVTQIFGRMQEKYTKMEKTFEQTHEIIESEIFERIIALR